MALARFAEAIAFDAGMGNSRQQADLLNGFARAWEVSMTKETDRQYQAAYVIELLTPAARNLIDTLAGMLAAVRDAEGREQ
jgi:hypothetical protein